MKHLINLPASDDDIKKLRSGDTVLINGIIYSARDKAHERIERMIQAGEKLPLDLDHSFIYYAGPSPTPPGKIIGSAGPTTSFRMDPFTETMLSLGVKGMIGKGKRDIHTRELLKKYGAVYFSSFGGAGAYLAKKIIKADIILFSDLGPEAIYQLEVKDFPVVVINDTLGSDLYEINISKS